jgi:hypothetical protein
LQRKDPNSAKSNGERLTGAKVVQLPREWLGPTEDLVPFGVSAEDSPPPPTSTSPPSAQSFWTEDAASLHAALQGSPPPEAAPMARRARTRWVPAYRLRPRFKAQAVPALTLSGIALAVIALIAVIAVIGSTLGSAHRPASARGQSLGARLAASTADIGRNAADWRLLARVNQGHGRAATHSPKASTRPDRAARPRHPRRHAPRAAAPSSAYRSTVSYHSPATVQPVTPAQTSATPSAPVYQPSSTSERRATSTSTSSTSNPNPASLLGPGHCACG